MKDQGLYLQHILDAIEKINAYTASGREAFMQSPMAQDAVIRNFEIIGEATKPLAPDLLERQPKVPWSDIARFRDLLIHHYMGVDLETVWNAVANHLPILQDAVEQLLHELDG